MCKNSFYLLSIFASKHLSITYNIIRRSVYTRKMCVFFFIFAEPIVLDIYIYNMCWVLVVLYYFTVNYRVVEKLRVLINIVSLIYCAKWGICHHVKRTVYLLMRWDEMVMKVMMKVMMTIMPDLHYNLTSLCVVSVLT